MPANRLVIACLLLFYAPAALAQTSAALMLMPWQENAQVEFTVSGHVFADGETDNSSANFDLLIFDSFGRVRMDTEKRGALSFGYDITYMDLSTSDPALPSRLTDQSIAVGLGLGEHEGWEVAMTFGIGYAGDNAYSDSDAVYLKADVFARKELDERSALVLGLNYHGNRSIFPDVPLPLVVYQYRVSETLSFDVGFPLSSVRWVPAERWLVQAFYVLPVSLDVMVSYEFMDSWRVFGQFASRTDVFKLNSQAEHRRVFFSQRMVEAGVRWDPSEQIRVIVAGGFRFDGEFETGYDVRDTDRLAELSDEPFIRMELRIAF